MVRRSGCKRCGNLTLLSRLFLRLLPNSPSPAVLLLLLAGAACAAGCSNFLVSKGASADGHTIVAYNADDDSLFGSLDHRPEQTWPANSMRQVWDWDSQVYNGVIPQVTHTNNVVGNCNDKGVCIIETTFGGLDELDGHGTPAIVSYGDLMFITLERVSTARDAIATMDALTQAYGYASSGESFAVADADEVWLMEMISKGKHGLGSVWVASRVPEGFVGATANQARTTTFVQNDPANVLFSSDVITFARSIGLYNGTDADFNFREAYDPISFFGARFAEARVYNMFNLICSGCVQSFLPFAQGYNTSVSMPLFVQVTAPLTLNDTMRVMRTHFEYSWFDNRGLSKPDVGANSGHSPYRFRPLTWSYAGDNATYLNERTVGTQQSGWAFIAEMRGDMPPPFRAVEWFAPDDSSTSPRVPVYGGATRIPAGFGSQAGQTPGGGVAYAPIADGFHMNMSSAFWIWNLVGNVAFSERYNSTFPVVVAAVLAAQMRMEGQLKAMDGVVSAQWATDPAGAVEAATQFGESTGQALIAEWTALWMFLFSTWRDGGLLTASTKSVCVPPQVADCVASLAPDSNEVGYDDMWMARIAGEGPEQAARYRVPAGVMENPREHAKLRVMAGKRRAA